MSRKNTFFNYVVSVVAILSLVLSFSNFYDTDKNVGANSTISALTEKTSLAHNDVFPIVDSTVTQTKKLKWGTATSSLKTLFDTTYAAIFSNSSGLAGLLSDETGSGFAVFANSPTITTPTIASFTNANHNHTNSAGGGQLTDSVFSSAIGIAKGGTGQTTAQAAIDALLPSQTSNSGKALTTNGTTASWGSFGAQVNYQSFTTNGTWNKPSGFTASATVVVQIWGGGGGGGGIDTSAGARGGGGGGGAYKEIRKPLSAFGSTESVTVGTGGNGGAAGTNNGSAGNNSSFGSHGTAYGGGGGGTNTGATNGSGGGGGGGLSAGSTGSAGGSGATGGSPAGASAQSSADGFAGAGGANFNSGGTSAGSSAYGGGGGGANTGNGGSSIYGGGGGASGSTAGTSDLGGAGGTSSAGAGGNGNIPAGGGGGAVASGGTTHAGGNGARGEVRVWVIE